MSISRRRGTRQEAPRHVIIRLADDRQPLANDGAAVGSDDTAWVCVARLRWPAMRDDEISADSDEMVRRFCRCRHSRRSGIPHRARDAGNPVRVRCRARSCRGWIPSSPSNAETVGRLTMPSMLARRSAANRSLVAAERIDAEHAGIDAMAVVRRRFDGGQQAGVGIVPAKAAEPEGSGGIEAVQERAQHQRRADAAAAATPRSAGARVAQFYPSAPPCRLSPAGPLIACGLRPGQWPRVAGERNAQGLCLRHIRHQRTGTRLHRHVSA